MIFVCFMIVMVIAIALFGKTPVTIQRRPWNHFYDNIQIPTIEFYTQVKEGLIARNIEGLGYYKDSFLESHIFSAKREYLRIVEHEYVFYVCVAPFGSGTFISLWLCIKDEKPIDRIPILNKLAGRKRDSKTFYQMDTEAMYHMAILKVVADVADSFTSEKGYRLSELDRKYQDAN